MKAVNVDGRAGYLEYGEGEDMIGIITASCCCSLLRWLKRILIPHTQSEYSWQMSIR